MLHPSYAELINALNSDVVEGDQPVVNSRYSVVLATAKRAREIAEAAEEKGEIIVEKPVTLAVNEFIDGKYLIEEPEDIRDL